MTEATDTNVDAVAFTCTKADFLDAQRLHHTLALRGRRFLLVVAAVTVVVTIAFMFGRRSTGIQDLVDSLPFVAMFFCLLALQILVTRLFVLPYNARRQFSQLKEFRGPMKVGVSSPRITVATKNGSSEIPTEDFLKWAENGKTILLYRSDRLMNLVPKRVASEVFRQSLIAELTRAGVPKAGFSNS